MQGGRIYSTAITTLTLLTSVRYRERFGDPRDVREPYKAAIAALRAAAKGGGGKVRDAAQASLERIFE